MRHITYCQMPSNLHYDEDECDDTEALKALVPDYFSISRLAERNIHYAV